MNDFIATLEEEFKKNANTEIAAQQKAYMKNQFAFFGLKAPTRRKIQKPFLDKSFLPEKKELEEIVKHLWQKPERDFQHFAMELTFKYAKQFSETDIVWFEFMALHKSWWDTIDFIAPSLMGSYFKLFPEKIEEYISKWLSSNNIWLQRCCVLFQLKYKETLDTTLLSFVINSLSGSKAFFVNKAIGWILRDYSNRNPKWVIEFANKTNLSNLSRREALRRIN